MTRHDHVKLAYEDFEPENSSPDLAPIVFLHGISDSKETWGNLPVLIADEMKRKAYAFDARNHGDSGWSSDFSFDLNADDLLHFMHIHDISKAVIIGHSMGGISCIKAALKEPDKFVKVIVIDMYAKRVPQKVANAVSRRMAQWHEPIQFVPSEYEEKEAVQFIVDYVYEKASPETKSQMNRESLYNSNLQLKRDTDGRYQSKMNVEAIIDAMKNVQTLMSEPQGIYHGPTYFIYGTKSKFHLEEEVEHIHQFFPNAIMIPIEGAFHNVHLDCPDTFRETLLRCLRTETRDQQVVNKL